MGIGILYHHKVNIFVFPTGGIITGALYISTSLYQTEGWFINTLKQGVYTCCPKVQRQGLYSFPKRCVVVFGSLSMFIISHYILGKVTPTICI